MPSGVYQRKGHSEETKRKIGMANKGKKKPPHVVEMLRKGRLLGGVGNKGRKFSSDLYPNRGMRGKKHKAETLTKLKTIQKLIDRSGMIGLKRSEETRAKIRKAREGQYGADTPNWKGGLHDKKYFYRQYRARKKGAEGSHTNEEWAEVKKKYNSTCPACLKKEPEIKLTEDHIVPLARGGSDFIENIQPLCRSCNSRKNARTIKYDFPRSGSSLTAN